MRKANCDCLKTVKEKLESKMVESEPKYEKGSSRWGNTPALMFDGSDNLPYMTLQYKKTGMKKDFEQSVFFSFCPFCGKEYKTV